MRLRSSTPRMVSGENSSGSDIFSSLAPDIVVPASRRAVFFRSERYTRPIAAAKLSWVRTAPPPRPSLRANGSRERAPDDRLQMPPYSAFAALELGLASPDRE